MIGETSTFRVIHPQSTMQPAPAGKEKVPLAEFAKVVACKKDLYHSLAHKGKVWTHSCPSLTHLS